MVKIIACMLSAQNRCQYKVERSPKYGNVPHHIPWVLLCVDGVFVHGDWGYQMSVFLQRLEYSNAIDHTWEGNSEDTAAPLNSH